MTAAAFNPAYVAFATSAAAATAGLLWRHLVPRLPEPHANTDEAELKIAYRDLATWPRTIKVAIAAAAAAAISAVLLPGPVQAPWLVLAVAGVVLAEIDGATTWIPAAPTRWAWAAMAAAGLLTTAAGTWTDLVRMLIGAIAAGILYLLLWLATRASFGFGDVRFVPLVAGPAAAVSWSTLACALILGSIAAAVHALGRRFRRRPGLNPWAPGMLAGGYAALLVTSALAGTQLAILR